MALSLKIAYDSHGVPKNPSLLINALSNWAALGINVVVGFFLTPYIIRQLGSTGYGIWTLVSSVIGYYGIFDLGVTSAITRYVAHYLGQRQFKSLNETINTSLALFGSAALLSIVLSFLLAGPLSAFFNLSNSNQVAFKYAIRLLGICAALGFPASLFSATVRAHERFLAANLVTVATTLLRTVLTLICLSRGLGLIGIAYSYVAASFVATILNLALCKLLFENIRFSIKYINSKTLSVLLTFGISTAILQIADLMRFNCGTFIIGRYIGLPAVAIFSVAALLIRYALEFVASGTQAVFSPRFASLYGQGNLPDLQRLFLKSLSISSFLSFPISLLLLIFGRAFIGLWAGASFLSAAPALSILAIGYAIALSQTTALSLLYALNKHHFFAILSVVEGIANLVLSILLAPRLGIIGVALGTTIPMLFIKLFIQPIYVSKLIGVQPTRYLRQLIPPFLVSLVLFIVVSFFIPAPSSAPGYVFLVAKAIPYILGFIVAYLFVRLINRNHANNSRPITSVRSNAV